MRGGKMVTDIDGKYQGLKTIGKPGFQAHLYIVNPDPRDFSNQLVEQMYKYIPELMDFAEKQKAKPKMVSFLPDHERIVLEMQDAQAAQKVIKAFQKSPHYKVKDNQFIPGDKEIYAKAGSYSGIEVKVSVERKITMC
jgi:hypothetical protein